MRVCNVHGCGTIYPASEGGRCVAHRKQADRGRGSATERGYNSKGHRSFRTQVIERDLTCVVCELAMATVADHYPLSRRELIESGMNPNDPQHGRGLCHTCHSIETAAHQPGGWADQ